MTDACLEMDARAPGQLRSAVIRRLIQLLTLVPYAAMGPISGPLAYWMVQSLRKGRLVLAAVYLALIVATFITLPLLVAKYAPGVLI